MVASHHWLISQAYEPSYMGVWGLCPQWGPGTKPLVRGLCLLEAKAIYCVNLLLNYCVLEY